MKVNSKGVIEANGNIAEFSSLADIAQRKADSFGKGSTRASSNISKLGATIGTTSAITTKFINVLESGLKSIAGFAKSSVQMFSHFEGIQSSLSGVLRDVGKGKAMFEDLRKFSFKTTFGVDTLADASQQLLNVGMHVDELKPSLMMLGNIAQGDTAKFQELVDIYGKILNTGKAGSMQLQQLALRGVPIQKMLKEMGKSGTASAKDITDAFEKMTASGGQFEEAMERINETIAGREAFISDTWRELLVSFAEATGLAEAYKEALNPIYETIQNIVYWLQSVNENPVAKKFFSGAVIAIVTALTGAIIGGLIPALITAVGAVTAMTGGLNLIIGALAGLAVGLGAFAGFNIFKKMSEDTDEATKKSKELKKEYEELKKTIKSGGDYSVGDVIKVNDFEIKQLEGNLAKMRENTRKEYSRRNADGWDAMDNVWMQRQAEVEQTLVKQIEDRKKEYEILKKQEQIIERESKLEKERLALIRQARQENEKFKTDYEGTKVGKDESERNRINEDLKFYQDMLANGKKQIIKEYNSSGQITEKVSTEKLTAEESRKVKIIIASLMEQFNNLSKEWTWRTLFDSASGQHTDILGSSKDVAIAEYMAKIGSDLEKTMKDSLDPLQDIMDKYGKSFMEVNDDTLKKAYDKNKSARDRLVETRNKVYDSAVIKSYEEGFKGDISQYNGTVEFIRLLDVQLEALNKNLDETAHELAESSKRTEMYNNGLSGLANRLNELSAEAYKNEDTGRGAKYQLASAGASALGNSKSGAIANGAIQGFAQGGIIGAIIGAIAGLLSKLEAFQDILGILDEILDPICDALNMILEVIGGILKDIISILRPFLKIISAILKAFGALLQIIGTVVKVILKVLSPFLKIIEKVANALDRFFTKIAKFFGYDDENSAEKQTEKELLEKLNEQLSRMSETIKNQIEYYYEMQQAMRSAFINEQISAGIMNGKVTSMNDGIITPNGVFSTAPDDYIMAMKHPEDLVKGGSVVNMNVVIKNTVSDTVQADVQQTTDENGEQQLFVTISKKIAGDVASGANGWDSALDYRTNRLRGRRLG